jgi:hypothetical protein
VLFFLSSVKTKCYQEANSVFRFALSIVLSEKVSATRRLTKYILERNTRCISVSLLCSVDGEHVQMRESAHAL